MMQLDNSIPSGDDARLTVCGSESARPLVSRAASGALGHETPQPQDLTTPRDGRVVNNAG